MKTAFITGGSRGVGKATVKAFLDKGYKVLTTSTSGKSVYENTYKLELSDPKSIQQLVDTVTKNGETIDVLINNAASGGDDEDMVDIKNLRQLLEINLLGTIQLTQGLLPLINKNGVIINISSQMASLVKDVGYDYPSYRISKAGLNVYAKSISLHPKILSRGIRVYCFDPGWVKTDMGGEGALREPEEPAKELLALTESNLESGLFYKGLKVREW